MRVDEIRWDWWEPMGADGMGLMGLMGDDGTRRAAHKRIEPKTELGLRRRDAGLRRTRGYNRLQPRPFFSKGGAIKRAVLLLPNLATFARRFGGKKPCDDLPPSAAPANARAPRASPLRRGFGHSIGIGPLALIPFWAR